MKALLFTGGMLGAVFLIFLSVILIPFLSGVAAMVVGWAFPIITGTIRELLGVYHLTDFQLGATLGFFGSFFRSTNFNND